MIETFIRQFEEKQSLLQLLGPFSLLATLAIGMKTEGIYNLDLLGVAIVGLFLSAKWEVRGSVYGIALLAISTFVKHLFFTDSHAVQFGIEASMGFALLISGMTIKEGNLFLASLNQKMDAKEQTIQNLEEEILRAQEQAAAEQISASEKLASLTQTLEEVQAETSALQMLNEVLRQSNARVMEEKNNIADSALQMSRKIGFLEEEMSALHKELARIGNESGLAIQNKELFSEINAARVKEAQTHLINETLARLHAKEAQKGKDLEGKLAQAIDELQQKQEQLSFARREAEMSSQQLEQLAAELQSAKESNNRLDQVSTEKELYRERAQKAETELVEAKRRIEELSSEQQNLSAQITASSTLSKSQEATLIAEKELYQRRMEEAEKELIAAHQTISDLTAEQTALLSKVEQSVSSQTEKDHLMAQLEELRAHLASQAKIEALHRQLKAQFEEKNQILHETRAQLFKSDTQLQTLQQQLEQHQLEADPVPVSIREELTALEEERRHLEAENQLLEELVTQLMKSPSDLQPLVVKKKLNKQSPPEQQSLF